MTKEEKQKVITPNEQQTRNLSAWMQAIGEPAKIMLDKTMAKVQSIRDSGCVVYPEQNDILKAFNLVHPDNVKVVILGQDPYHEPNQANGLAFSVPDGARIPPSLRNIFKELSDDIGCPVPQTGNLEPWAEKGVFLLNSVLTVEEHNPNSHNWMDWDIVTSHALYYLLKSDCTSKKPVVYICWGKDADATLCRAIDLSWGVPPTHYIIRSTHPSPFSARKDSKFAPAFLGSKPFSKANKWLTEHGAEPVDWTL